MRCSESGCYISNQKRRALCPGRVNDRENQIYTTNFALSWLSSSSLPQNYSPYFDVTDAHDYHR